MSMCLYMCLFYQIQYPIVCYGVPNLLRLCLRSWVKTAGKKQLGKNSREKTAALYLNLRLFYLLLSLCFKINFYGKKAGLSDAHRSHVDIAHTKLAVEPFVAFLALLDP